MSEDGDTGYRSRWIPQKSPDFREIVNSTRCQNQTLSNSMTAIPHSFNLSNSASFYIPEKWWIDSQQKQHADPMLI